VSSDIREHNRLVIVFIVSLLGFCSDSRLANLSESHEETVKTAEFLLCKTGNYRDWQA
jgi:hypothetical protein